MLKVRYKKRYRGGVRNAKERDQHRYVLFVGTGAT